MDLAGWRTTVPAAVVAVAATAVVAVVDDTAGPDPAGARTVQADDERSTQDRGDERRHGPPPWVRGGDARGKADGKADGKAGWKAGWKALTPRQRERRMTRLAQQHADGVRAWSRCVVREGDDCDKPLPPGHAKRLPDR